MSILVYPPPGPSVRRWLLCLAVARMEGFFLADPKARARRNKNPGNLTWTPKRFRPLVGMDDIYVRFGSIGGGWAALENDLTAKIRRRQSLAQIIPIYAPAGHGANDPAVYIRNCADWLRLDPHLSLFDWLDGVAPSVAGPYPDGRVPVGGPPVPFMVEQ